MNPIALQISLEQVLSARLKLSDVTVISRCGLYRRELFLRILVRRYCYNTNNKRPRNPLL